jgi:uncharacterized membrane protein YfcA
MSIEGLIIFGIAGFLSSIISGIAGAGGGFIMTPLGIFLGLSPAQAVSTGKFSGLSVTVGALFGMKKAHGTVSWARIIPVMVLAFVVGLFVPLVIKSLDSEIYRTTLGVILILMIPVMMMKKIGIKRSNPNRVQKIVGGGLLTFALILQGIFSGGLGTLVNLALMGMLGMTALEANITKRWSQLILNAMIIVGVLGSGFIVWQVVVVGVITTFFGSMVGGRIAVRKGDSFIANVLIILMFISGIGLIIS